MFTAQEIIRYSKQFILDDIGIAGQLKLKAARVLVIGAGGLGCPVLQQLNAIGVGTIGMADFDVVAATNLHRQILYGPADIGRKKVVVATEQLAAQNPFTMLIAHDFKIDHNNADAIINDYDFVVDGCDNFEARYAVNDACVRADKPLISGSILGYQGQIAVFNSKGSRQLRDLFPEPPDAADVPDCAENGVLGTVPAIIGAIMAQTVVSVIMGWTSFENQLIVIDTRTMERTLLSY